MSSFVLSTPNQTLALYYLLQPDIRFTLVSFIAPGHRVSRPFLSVIFVSFSLWLASRTSCYQAVLSLSFLAPVSLVCGCRSLWSPLINTRFLKVHPWLPDMTSARCRYIVAEAMWQALYCEQCFCAFPAFLSELITRRRVQTFNLRPTFWTCPFSHGREILSTFLSRFQWQNFYCAVSSVVPILCEFFKEIIEKLQQKHLLKTEHWEHTPTIWTIKTTVANLNVIFQTLLHSTRVL